VKNGNVTLEGMPGNAVDKSLFFTQASAVQGNRRSWRREMRKRWAC
jgi:hypothetical protein